MSEIYIAFVDTPGIFAGIIGRVIQQKYIHVVISMDPELEEAYSVGRRHPAIPLLAGFEKEEKQKILKVFPQADYMICKVPCTEEQKMQIRAILRETMAERYSYHYAVLGLSFILLNRPFYQKNHYTCSSFIAKLLEETGVWQWEKHFSLVTPKDFMEQFGEQKIFEGGLWELVDEKEEEGEFWKVAKALWMLRLRREY